MFQAVNAPSSSLQPGVFGDLLSRDNPALLCKAKAILKSYRMKVQHQVDSGVYRPTAVKQLGLAFVRHVWPMIKAAKRTKSAFCFARNSDCPWVKPLVEPTALNLHLAGMTCVDWSGLGNVDNWLGDSALVFLSWLAQHIVEEPMDLMVCECVTNFDDQMLGELAGAEGYALTTFRVSPEMFGFPATRQRKYMILFRKEKLQWQETVVDPVSYFNRLFERPLVMQADVFWCAPEALVNRFHQEWARSKHLPANQQRGSSWPSKSLMTKDTRKRVRGWEECFGKRFISRPNVFVIVQFICRRFLGWCQEELPRCSCESGAVVFSYCFFGLFE